MFYWRPAGSPAIEARDALSASPDSARDLVRTGLAELGESAERVSRAIGAEPDFLRRYLAADKPGALPAPLRRRLADYLGLPEQALR